MTICIQSYVAMTYVYVITYQHIKFNADLIITYY